MFSKLLLAASIVALTVFAAAPAADANSVPTTGTRIALFIPPATFPADTPFYIEQGFECQAIVGEPDYAGDCMTASTHFDLWLDGAQQPSTVDIDNAPGAYLKRDLTNYPNGLPAGSHTFVGVFVFDGVVTQTVTATIVFTG
jgi:hypothetical protein